MKNKGRKHIAGKKLDCKGTTTYITRDIRSMSSRSEISTFDKSAWNKRRRGYFKSQTKDLMDL